MRSDRIFGVFFGLLLANEMVAGAYREVYPLWYFVSKPLLLFAIVAYFWTQTSQYPHGLRNFLLAGFFFSLFGDTFLMFQSQELYFLLGLAAFFVAHVCYILGFRLWTYDNLEIPLVKRHPWLVFVLMLYGYGFYKVLEPGLGQLEIPVIAYMAVILLMVIIAMNRQRKVSRIGFGWVMSGALLFMLSDSILAYNKFIEEVPYSGIWIMLTYGAAQLFIMFGGLVELRRIGRLA